MQQELRASRAEYSLLISAYSLNSTWTPLIGGILANTFGTTFTSVLTTGVIFSGKFHKCSRSPFRLNALPGQLLLLLGDILGNVRLMVFGLWIFGLGISPLAVVQGTIIVRFFRALSDLWRVKERSLSHRTLHTLLQRSLALGLPFMSQQHLRACQLW